MFAKITLKEIFTLSIPSYLIEINCSFVAQTNSSLIMYKYTLVWLLHPSSSPTPNIEASNLGVVFHEGDVLPKHVTS